MWVGVENGGVDQLSLLLWLPLLFSSETIQLRNKYLLRPEISGRGGGGERCREGAARGGGGIICYVYEYHDTL